MTAPRLPDLDRIALNLMLAATDALPIRRTRANVSRLAGQQIAFREAMRAVLPPEDPRRDPAYRYTLITPQPKSSDE